MSDTTTTQTENTENTEEEGPEFANYMHLKLGEGGFMSAAILITDGDDGAEVASVGLSYCSPKDQFSRKKGRMVAEGRVNTPGKSVQLTLDPDKMVSVQVREAIEAGIASDDIWLPGWV